MNMTAVDIQGFCNLKYSYWCCQASALYFRVNSLYQFSFELSDSIGSIKDLQFVRYL
eukprot:m.32604 g.32604  ORF g.32604 m.32604 type:complete len:57 (-) comp14141_c1_seq1:40-210(-)